MEFTLTAINLDAPNDEETVNTGIRDDKYYVFSRSKPCNRYSFRVTAENSLGRNTSEDIVASLPSTPDLSLAEVSHSLHKDGGNFFVTLFMMVAT